MPALAQNRSVTLEDYEKLPEDVRAEVFSGEIFYMASPSQDHQAISMEFYYQKYGVREYWIVDPIRKSISVNYFEGNKLSIPYTFAATIKVNIYEDLYIDFSEIEEAVWE